jgi:hypothetical protein
VLAQVDGICQDLVGSKEDMQVFRLVPKAHQYFADASTIAGVPAGSSIFDMQVVTQSIRRVGVLIGAASTKRRRPRLPWATVRRFCSSVRAATPAM